MSKSRRALFLVAVLAVGGMVLLAWLALAGRPIFGRTESVAADDLAAAVAGSNAFARDLYGQLRSTEGNLFFSPVSGSTALTMAYAGARGDTAGQMRSVLHLSLPDDLLHPALAVLVSKLAASAKKKGCELSVANALWGQQGEGFLQAFLDLMKGYYGAGFREVDFKKDAEGAAKQINAWAEKQTRGKIKGVIPTGFLDPLTRLVLTSAIYFKGLWDAPFEREATRTEDFMVTAEQRVQVPMMHQMETFSCFEDDELQVLEMPYKEGRLSMAILLPRKVERLDALEDAFGKGAADEWLRTLRPLEVEVAMPRFTMTVESRMDEALKSLGMTDAFALPPADFSGMNGTKGDLFLDAVLHKAFVEVNEEGTEAAAVSAGVVEMAAVAGATTFRADHPFLFLIRDRRTGCILFLGRLTNPGA